jgi:hypothetical protein
MSTYALYFAQTMLLGRLKATRRWLEAEWVTGQQWLTPQQELTPF